MPKIKVGFIPVGEMPRIEVIEGKEDETGYVSYYEAIRNLIGCRLIDSFSPLYDDEPLLFVDDEGIYNSVPNRAVFANKHMEKLGYLSTLDYTNPVKEGDLHSLLFGNIVAVSYEYDEEGNDIARDITDEEFEQLKKDFDDPDNGVVVALAIKNGATNIHRDVK